MRCPLVPVLLPLAAAAAGCGGSGSAATSAPARQPVQLRFSAPLDTGTTRAATVQVSGSVTPASARVLVLGERVPVTGGRFAKTVDLREGTNVIDVGASAPGARATWRALRVTRDSKIGVPDVIGQEASAAKARLQGLGLDVRILVEDGLLDAFRNGPRLVCRTDPAGGSQVDRNSHVDVVVSKTC